jgi:hypothetical protein
MAADCYICGRETPPTNEWNMGPADLCDTHYGAWFHAFTQATGTDEERHRKACESIGYVYWSERDRTTL